MNYRISEEVVEDLEEIWLFTLQNWSLEQADRYYQLLINEIEFIAAHIDIGKPMDHIKAGYRMTKVKSHLIFYRQATDEVIDIIRILHQRMDIEDRLK